MGKRSDIDWEKIEKLYSLGQLSVREIARQCNVQPSSITRRAKKEDWTKDPSKEVRERTRAALISNTKSNSPTRDDIESAVRTNIEVVREHRKDISQGRGIVGLLMGQLTDVAENREIFQEIVESETQDDGNGKRLAAMKKAISIPSHAGVIRDLSTAMKNFVALERQAFSLDDGGEDEEICVVVKKRGDSGD